MEKQKQIRSSSKDTADAKLEVFREEVETRAIQLMQKALIMFRIGLIGTEDLSKFSVTEYMSGVVIFSYYSCCKCKVMNPKIDISLVNIVHVYVLD